MPVYRGIVDRVREIASFLDQDCCGARPELCNCSAAIGNAQALLVLTDQTIQHGGQSAFDFDIGPSCAGVHVGLVIISTIIEILK